ncbi:hypothetical protein PILCRDRAFT_641534 [Piloderma croceum F 1598]|uniref:Uncharacterized protein n=1 Tax=Piloderma croceum (strain F 1598) TaxID=765440 RepID=A0A0C3ARL3_PILCF|nr:hypothetical protein PILCRDRAFT_641534 [Piloderma croceum F 1598]
MSDPLPGKQSKKSRLLQPFKGLFSRRRSRSPSHQVAGSVTAPNMNAPISASPTNNATSATQVNPQGTEYTAIVELSTTPSGPLTWEQRMKEGGSTAYEGLKTAIQGIHDCSGSFPPLQTAAGVFLTISKVVDRVSANRRDLEQLGVKLRSILSIVGKYRENGGLRALDYRIGKFCLWVGSSFCPYLFDAPKSSSGPSILK